MTKLALALATVGVLAGCDAGPPPEALRTEPGPGGVATIPFTSVRVWFNDATDLDASELALQGPAGSVTLTGVHSMGEGDLMAAVSGATPAGDYTLTWTAAGTGGGTATGEVRFTVSAGEPDAAAAEGADAAAEDPPSDDGP